MDPAFVHLVVQDGHVGARSVRSSMLGSVRLVGASRPQIGRLFISPVLYNSTSSGGIDAGTVWAFVSLRR